MIFWRRCLWQKMTRSLLNISPSYFFLKTTDSARWRDCYELCQLSCKYCGYKTSSPVKYQCKLFVSKMFLHYFSFWPDMVSNWVKQKWISFGREDLIWLCVAMCAKWLDLKKKITLNWAKTIAIRSRAFSSFQGRLQFANLCFALLLDGSFGSLSPLWLVRRILT